MSELSEKSGKRNMAMGSIKGMRSRIRSLSLRNNSVLTKKEKDYLSNCSQMLSEILEYKEESWKEVKRGIKND